MSVDKNYQLLQETQSPLQESLLPSYNHNNDHDNVIIAIKSPLHIDNIKNDNNIANNNQNNEYVIENNNENNVENINKELDTNTTIWSVSWVIIEEGKDIVIKNGMIATIFLLLNSMIGSGILVQAYVFRKTGLVSVLFEYIIIGSMNYIGVNTLILLAEKQNIFDYSKLVKSILGSYGEYTVDCCIVISGFGSLLSYILIIGTLMTEVTGDCNEWYCNIAFLTILPVTLFTVPLCLLRNFGHLVVASYISMVIIVSIIFLVVIGGPIEHKNHVSQYNLGNGSGSISTVGDIVFALGYITATFHAYQAMNDTVRIKYNQITLTTTIIGACMCFITGLAGYLSFGDDVQTNILQNFHGPVGSVFKLFLIVHLILYIPGDFVISRAAFLRLFSIEVTNQSNTSYISTSLIFIYTITIVAIVLQVYSSNTNNLGIVIDITGGTTGSLLYFIIPGICGLVLFKDNETLYRWNLFLTIFGSIIFIFVITAIALNNL